MDFVDLSLNMCSSIYNMAENMKANKDRCKRVSQRVKALQELVLTIKERGSTQNSSAVENALKELCASLTSAEETMRKFSQTKGVMRFLKSGNHEDKFSKINESLTDNFQVLTGALQIEQGHLLQKMYENVSARKQHEGYGEADPICSTVHTTPLPPTINPNAHMPESSPTSPMSPMPMTSPTAPYPAMLVCCPPAPMLPMPVPSATAAMSVPSIMPHVQMYSPTSAMPVRCNMSPRPASVPAAQVGPPGNMPQTFSAMLPKNVLKQLGAMGALAPQMGGSTQNAATVTGVTGITGVKGLISSVLKRK